MKNLFSIGEVAKQQNISKQTLIYYDKIGLFSPAYVDPDTGYRFYSAAQLDYLDTILIMKRIGFSLKEIREHMKNYTIDSSLAALRKQMTVIERQIGELRMIRSRVEHRCSQMDVYLFSGIYPAQIYFIPVEIKESFRGMGVFAFEQRGEYSDHPLGKCDRESQKLRYSGQRSCRFPQSRDIVQK